LATGIPKIAAPTITSTATAMIRRGAAMASVAILSSMSAAYEHPAGHDPRRQVPVYPRRTLNLAQRKVPLTPPPAACALGFIHRPVGIEEDLLGRPLVVLVNIDNADAGMDRAAPRVGGHRRRQPEAHAADHVL
jgi:hypothetical protein